MKRPGSFHCWFYFWTDWAISDSQRSRRQSTEQRTIKLNYNETKTFVRIFANNDQGAGRGTH